MKSVQYKTVWSIANLGRNWLLFSQKKEGCEEHLHVLEKSYYQSIEPSNPFNPVQWASHRYGGGDGVGVDCAPSGGWQGHLCGVWSFRFQTQRRGQLENWSIRGNACKLSLSLILKWVKMLYFLSTFFSLQKLLKLRFIAFCLLFSSITVKILKIGTPKIITIIVLQLEQLDFTVQ